MKQNLLAWLWIKFPLLKTAASFNTARLDTGGGVTLVDAASNGWDR